MSTVAPDFLGYLLCNIVLETRYQGSKSGNEGFWQPQIAALMKQCALIQCHGKSADVLPQMLQNLPAEVLVNCLAWWKKFMITSAITVNTDN